MAILNSYLTFSGNCEEAFTFYKSVFGGEFSYIGRYKDMPPAPELMIPESEKEKIMHIALPISKETVLFGADIPKETGQVITPGNNFSLSVSVKSEEEARRIFDALSNGGRVTMPLENTFWGAYFGMLVDRFGISWMVSHEHEY